MRFVHAELLWLLAALPLLALLGWWNLARRTRALERFAGGELSEARLGVAVSAHRRAAKQLLLFLALAAVILAAARPQWGSRMEEVNRRGVDVVVVIDTSLSMLAEDVAPSRLARARHQTDALLERLAGNRVALVTFAGQATLLTPLTLDHAAVRLFLDTIEGEAGQVAGTALADALRLAVTAFSDPDAGDEERTRAIVLFTDGEDHEGELDVLPGELKQAGVGLFAVGCGSTRGAPIPLHDEAGNPSGYKKDGEGKVVTTRLEEGVLESLALEVGGRYYRSSPGGDEIDEIAKAVTSLDSREYGAVLRARYEDRYQIPLLVALLALCAETVLGDGRRRAAGTGGEGA
jgi:Ca-activated chloride channel family protein